jgi:thioredoxin-related protein
MKKLSVLFIAFFTGHFCFAQSELDKALTKAKSENKLVFIDTYFTGCIPCEQMDKEVFPNTAVNKEMEKNFIMLKVNVFTEKLGDTLKAQHILNGFPTFLVLNRDGNLVASISGFKDPGDLITFLSHAKSKADKGLIHAGYSATYNEKNYPAFYLEFAKTRKGLDDEKLKKYTDTLADLRAANALLPFLITRRTNTRVSAEILQDYNFFDKMYGTEVLQPVVNRMMSELMHNKLNTKSTNQDFENFVNGFKENFSASTFKNTKHILSNEFFLNIKRDTLSYLNYNIKNPILYQYHFTALANMLIAKKQLHGETAKLFIQWADAIINQDSSMEMIKTAASINKQLNNSQGYKKLMQMAINRAKKYDMPYQEMEESLKTSSR